MRLSEVELSVRDEIQDPTSSTEQWSSQELTRYIDWAAKYMFRHRCERDYAYYNLELDILGSAATQLHSSTFLYHLPRWVYQVIRVRETKTSTDIAGTNFFPAFHGFTERVGWSFDAAKRLRFVGRTTAPDLTLSVCKIPARLHLGTCAGDAPSTTTMLTANLPAASDTEYQYENEVDAYRNAIFEITGGSDGVRDPEGQIGRVVASSRVSSGSNYRIQLTMEQAWTENPDSGDAYEMHPEIDDAHARLLVLLAAQQAFQSRHNVGGLEAIRMELLDERARYLDSCKPADDGQPAFIGTELEIDQQSDPDRDFLLGRYGGI